MNLISPHLIILTAPSGSGKSTIKQHLLKQYSELGFSVSATTRPRRDSEVHGRDYYFISEDDFRSRMDDNQFVEWEEVYPGKFYGTLESEIDRLYADDKIIVLDIDVEGAKRIKRKYKDYAFAMFIMPPSIEELEKRLKNRRSETPSSLKRRIDKANIEMQSSEDFDVVLVNDALEVAFQESEQLVSAFLNQLKLEYQ